MNQSLFNFMPQCQAVKDLLNACLAVLPHAPAPERAALTQALKEFETFGAPTMWSADDVTKNLTPGERRKAIEWFIADYECKDSDWIAIGQHADAVLAEREVLIRVNYDPLFTGGEYSGTPQAAMIPLALIQSFQEEDPSSDGVDLAFGKHTKIDPMHIVGYNLEDRYNQDGELIPAGAEEEEEEGSE